MAKKKKTSKKKTTAKKKKKVTKTSSSSVKSSDISEEDALRALTSSYYQEIQSAARNIIEESKQGYDIDEAINSYADGHVIYTKDALIALTASSNWTAIDDMGMEAVGDFSDYATKAAYFAVEQDVREAVDRLGFEENPAPARPVVLASTKKRLLR